MDEKNGQFQSVWADVDGLSVHARTASQRAGEDPRSVVLVPGLALSSRVMLPTGKALVHTYRVFAVDPPGYGLSAKPEPPLTITQLADSLNAWMKVMGLERAIVIGNSAGCQVAVDMALRYPTRAAALVLTGPTMDPRTRGLFGSMARWARELPMETSMYGTMVRDYLDCGPRRFLAYAASARQDRIEDKIPLLKMPVLIMRGSLDPLVSPAWAERLAGLAPNGRLVTVPGAAHNLTFLAPDAVAEATIAWDSKPTQRRARRGRASRRAA